MNEFKVTFPGNRKANVAFNGFEVKTDQPKDEGGDGTAPEPFAVFLSGLAACSGIYAKSFCDFRKIDTEGMHLHLDVSRKEGQKLIEELNITLHVNQQFPEKYIKPIIKVISGCAVKNQLHPDIKTNIAIAYLQS